MAVNLGKKFEYKFKEDWALNFPNSFIYRLVDQTNGRFHSVNPCDFIAFENRKLFLIELKCHEGNTIPFSCLSQLDTLISYTGIEGLFPIIIVWFQSHDKVIYVKAKDLKQMREDGFKSINITKQDQLEKYNIVEIPSIKKRTFLDSDYTILDSIV